MTYLQLAFVIPLYTVFFLHGLTLPKSLPLKTVVMAIGLTVLILGVLISFQMAFESPS